MRAPEVICGTVEICATPQANGQVLVTIEADLDDAGVGRASQTIELEETEQVLEIYAAAETFARELVRDLVAKLKERHSAPTSSSAGS